MAARAKADHIRADWQDAGLARMWQNTPTSSTVARPV
jgi:hypothetical protein